MTGRTVLIIPAYEPDERLVQLMGELAGHGVERIILIDDGSGDAYRDIFERAVQVYKDKYDLRSVGDTIQTETTDASCHADRSPAGDGDAPYIMLLTHEKNCGKGRALKTAMAYALEQLPDLAGCVTADSDGQHHAEDILRVGEALTENEDALILGVRTFEGMDVPWKSRAGNTITRFVFRLLTGISTQDTQTGLRGIPAALMRECLDLPGERFEFETQMLMACKDRFPVRDLPIRTIYDSAEHHSTHFDPFADSFKIYRVLLGDFVRYLFSSVSSFVVDILLFRLFAALLPSAAWRLLAATVCARVLSSCYNYAVNRIFVFKSKRRAGRTFFSYALLACCIMLASGGCLTLFMHLFPGADETAAKVVIDAILFFVSYFVQKRVVF